jgi:hypothetical protein
MSPETLVKAAVNVRKRLNDVELPAGPLAVTHSDRDCTLGQAPP